MPQFQRIRPTPAEWSALLERFPDREVTQTPAWLEFLRASQKAEPVHAALVDGDRILGYFTGAIVRKLGLRILGSPFPGWTTSYAGFNLEPGVPRRVALEALPEFAFRTLGCHHVEVLDRDAVPEDADGLGYEYRTVGSYEVDLTLPEDALFGRMSSACRRAIRKARKSGLVVEEATDPGFADEFYSQLQDVFAKQGIFPTYPRDRVRALVEHLLPTGNLLLLRARTPEGECIATGVYPAYNRTMYFWGGASWRQHQILRPNELLMHEAMLRGKARGLARFDLLGDNEYKRKYSPTHIGVPWFRRSRYRWLMPLRRRAEWAFFKVEDLRGRLAGLGAKGKAGAPAASGEDDA
jgi:CelD/BcsL family acetyltransferase involved in cellulose biosynthesis